jgi:hypothetical protein
MYCSICGNKCDNTQYLYISLYDVTIRICSYACLSDLQDGITRSREGKSLPTTNGNIEE